jgi:hypothetical protein
MLEIIFAWCTFMKSVDQKPLVQFFKLNKTLQKFLNDLIQGVTKRANFAIFQHFSNFFNFHWNNSIGGYYYWNENSDSCFRFNNPKQRSNWMTLVSFCSSCLAILQCSFYENLKDWSKNRFSAKIQNSLCITTKSLYTNFKRNYLENYNNSEHAVKTKNAPFFMIFSNISFFHMVLNYWTGSEGGGGV